jgi:hypothetical protein
MYSPSWNLIWDNESRTPQTPEGLILIWRQGKAVFRKSSSMCRRIEQFEGVFHVPWQTTILAREPLTCRSVCLSTRIQSNSESSCKHSYACMVLGQKGSHLKNPKRPKRHALELPQCSYKEQGQAKRDLLPQHWGTQHWGTGTSRQEIQWRASTLWRYQRAEAQDKMRT